MNASADAAAEQIPRASEFSRRRDWRTAAVFLILFVSLVIGMLASIRYGPVKFELNEVLAAIMGSGDHATQTIIRELRLPRTIIAALVGFNLSLAGVLMQTIARNPLADPGLTGISSGAALVATAVMVLSTGQPAYLTPLAGAGALAAAVVVLAISWQPGQGTSPLRMILAGVGVNSILLAATQFLMIYYSDRVQPVLLWLSGNLIGISWRHVPLVLPYSLVCFVVAMLLARQLNVLQLGDKMAAGLGVRVARLRFGVLALAAVSAAAAVSVAGLVSFVGLMVPHMLRMIVGSNSTRLLPAAALAGAVLLVWADLLARNLRELPVGILTAAIGGPYFVALLYRKKLL